MYYYEVEFMAERVMATVNNRPLSLSNVGRSLCPNDLRPLYNSAPDKEKTDNFIAAHESIQSTIDEFERNWQEIYSLSIIKMKKWLQDSVTL